MRLVRSLLVLVGAVLMVHAVHADVIYNWDFNTPWSGTDGDKSGYGTGWGVRGGGLLPNGNSAISFPGSAIGSGTMIYAAGSAYGRAGGVAVITNTSTDPSKGVAFNLKIKDPVNPSDPTATNAFRTAFENSVNKQYNPYVQVEIWNDGTVPSGINNTNIPDNGAFGIYTNFVASTPNGARTNFQGQVQSDAPNVIGSGVWNKNGWNTYRIELDSKGVAHGYVNSFLLGSSSGSNILTLADAFSASTGLFLNPGAKSMVVDNFQFGVTPVPEPETYAMLLAGLGVMAAIARRRKAKQA